jgi:hypothetical protein
MTEAAVTAYFKEASSHCIAQIVENCEKMRKQ